MEKLSKRKRRFYIILSSILIVLYIGAISFNFFLERLVKKEIISQINNNPHGLYQLTFEEISIKAFRGHLIIKNLNFIPSDSALQLLNEGKIKKLIHSNIPEFRIKSLSVFDFIINKKIEVGAILIEGIQVDYLINTNVVEAEKKNTFVLTDAFSESFTGASIGKIQINTEELRFHSVNTDENLFSIDSVSLAVESVKINQETLKLPIPVVFSDIRINTRHFMLSSMEHYRIGTEDVQFNVQDSSLTIQGFKLIPKHSREEYNKIIKYNNDWFSINTTSITFKGLSVDELEFNDVLSFESVEVKEPVIEIYRDKRLPDAPFKYKALLGGMIKAIPIDINIDTLIVSDAKLKYEEQTESSNEPGLVFFNPLSVKAYPVTNHAELIETQPTLTIDLKGEIMAEALLEATLKIDLSSDHEEFSIRGTLEPVSAPVFNPMVERLMPVSIASGNITKTNFQFSANDDISNGTLVLEYTDVKVDVITGKDQTKKSGLISLVANGFVRGNNQPDKGKYIIGTIRFERRKDKAIVNFLWNSVKTGIISVIAPIADQNKKFEKQNRKENKKTEQEKRKKRRKK